MLAAAGRTTEFGHTLRGVEGTDRPTAPPPVASRPRMFGGVLEPVMLPWGWAVDRLVEARHYWIATTRPDGRPHTRPVWGVWLDERVHFSTGSRAAWNLLENREITVHVERHDDIVIIEGVVADVDDAVTRRVVEAYNAKYRWDLDPDALPGPFHRVEPRVVFGWTSDDSGSDGGAAFHSTATRWRFGPAAQS